MAVGVVTLVLGQRKCLNSFIHNWESVSEFPQSIKHWQFPSIEKANGCDLKKILEYIITSSGPTKLFHASFPTQIQAMITYSIIDNKKEETCNYFGYWTWRSVNNKSKCKKYRYDNQKSNQVQLNRNVNWAIKPLILIVQFIGSHINF